MMSGVDKWRSEILRERIRDLNDVPFVIGGVQCYGGGVDAEIKAAIRAHESDDLEECERWCLEAEARSLRRYDPGFEPREECDVCSG